MMSRMELGKYAEGGYITGAPIPDELLQLDPDECVINHDRECIRPDHPTETSDGNKPGAWWKCKRTSA